MATPTPVAGYQYLYFLNWTVDGMYYVMGWNDSTLTWDELGSGVTIEGSDDDSVLNNPPGPPP